MGHVRPIGAFVPRPADGVLYRPRSIVKARTRGLSAARQSFTTTKRNARTPRRPRYKSRITAHDFQGPRHNLERDFAKVASETGEDPAVGVDVERTIGCEREFAD